MYNGVNKLIAENLDLLAKEEVAPAFPAGTSDDPMHQSQEGDRLLKAMRKVWDDHTGNMHKLSQVLRYMARGLRFIFSVLFAEFSYRINFIHELPTSLRFGRQVLLNFCSISFSLACTQSRATLSPQY